MMGDLGYYEPAERLFQKMHLLWRAVRILLDVGLHTRSMSPAAAIVYLLEKVPIDPAEALAEVRRYCGGPTYQLCYAVGRRDILALRASYLEREGPGGTMRGFHDALMRYGGLPVSLARWGIGVTSEEVDSLLLTPHSSLLTRHSSLLVFPQSSRHITGDDENHRPHLSR
jgi:uncharacterized protein (DUF885 family)